MTEHTADLITTWLVVIIYPLVGIAKLGFVWVMRRFSPKQTVIGKWIMRMFLSIGTCFILIGAVFGVSLLAKYELWMISSWARMVMRVAIVMPALLSLVATFFLWRRLRPMLQALNALALEGEEDIRIADLLRDKENAE